jgi:hypothetical protein
MNDNDCKKNKDCGCESSLTTPQPCVNIFDCPNDNCSETFDSKCILYTDDPIECGTDEVVSQGDTVEEALGKIVTYFCNNLPSSGTVTVIGQGSINVESTATGNDIVYTVSQNPKFIDYKEVTIPVVISVSSPTPSTYNFPSAPYQTLTHTNSDTVSKTYKVFVSYETSTVPFSPNNSDVANWVDGAIIKTVSATDTILYESLGSTALSGSLFDGATTNDRINIATTDKVLTVNGDPIEFRFQNASLPKNVSFFYLVSLQPNETVSLKFKTKDNATPSNLLKAQMIIEEI